MKPTPLSSIDLAHEAALTASNLSLLVFSLNGQLYGLPITQVVRIIEMVAITHLPGAPEAIKGVINLWGKTTPVMDLRCRFGLPARPYGLHTPLILVDTDGRGHNLGVVVDTVEDVLSVSPEEVELTPTIMPQAIYEQMEARTDYLTGIAKIERRLILILDVAALLNPTDRRQLSAVLGQKDITTKADFKEALR
jgi:purine-binding chemotaxis protein CheW